MGHTIDGNNDEEMRDDEQHGTTRKAVYECMCIMLHTSVKENRKTKGPRICHSPGMGGI